MPAGAAGRPPDTVRLTAGLGAAGCLDTNILSESLEPISILLHDGDSDVPRLACLEISYGSGSPRVCAVDDRAIITISQIASWYDPHVCCSISESVMTGLRWWNRAPNAMS